MRRLGKGTLQTLLQTYETALAELEKLRDPSVTNLVRRLERHRAEVIAALTAQ